jgi:hypothetical protein
MREFVKKLCVVAMLELVKRNQNSKDKWRRTVPPLIFGVLIVFQFFDKQERRFASLLFIKIHKGVVTLL